MKVHAILACTNDHVIGHEDAIPWKMADDMSLFKTLTKGHAVVVGFRTFMGMLRHYPRKKLMPDRIIYVAVSFDRMVEIVHDRERINDWFRAKCFEAGVSDVSNIHPIDIDGTFVANRSWAKKPPSKSDVDAFITRSCVELRSEQEVFIAGGAAIYDAFISGLESVYVTVIHDWLRHFDRNPDAFDYDVRQGGNMVTLGDHFIKAVFSSRSDFKRNPRGLIFKSLRNDYNATWYSLTRSINAGTSNQVLQGASSE